MPVFLTENQVTRIHRNIIEVYGGADGLRDNGLLASALAMPQATFDGKRLHEDIVSMATAYWFHLTANHPFVDGNKRVGVACALIFLDLNGIGMDTDQRGVYSVAMSIATGGAAKNDIDAYLRTVIVNPEWPIPSIHRR